MSTSDTDTTAASAALARLRKAVSAPDQASGTKGKPDADGSDLAVTAGAKRPGAGGAAPQHSGQVAATDDSAQIPEVTAPPAAAPTFPPETISQRIAHPVPRHHVDDTKDLDELLHPEVPRLDSGPTFRHMSQAESAEDLQEVPHPALPNAPATQASGATQSQPKTPVPTQPSSGSKPSASKPSAPSSIPSDPVLSNVVASAPTKVSDPTDLPGQGPDSTIESMATTTNEPPHPGVVPPAAKDVAAVAGGNSAVNNWLDSIHEPNWQSIGDKVYSSPATFRLWLRKVRAERAHAAEEREQTRLLEVAHTEALAEVAKRQATTDAAAAAVAAAKLALDQERQRVEQEQAEQLRLEHARAEQDRIEQEQAEQERRQAEQEHAEQQQSEQQVSSHQPEPVTESYPSVAQPGHVGLPADDAETTTLPVAQLQTAVRTPMAPEQLAALVASAKAAIRRHQELLDPVYVAPYTLPDTSPDPEHTTQDFIRRLVFTAVAAFMAFFGVLGTGGLISGSNAWNTLLSPAPAAFMILPVAFCWSLASAIHAWLPAQRSAVRQRAVGWEFTTALAAAGVWLAAVLAGIPFLIFLAATLCLVLLLRSVRELNRNTARNTTERMFTDAPISLLTGFFLVVFAANLAELLASWNVSAVPVVASALAVLALGYVATGLSMSERGRIIMATGFAWGMFWLLVPRLLGPNPSILIAILAGMAGFVVLLATENRRYQIHHAEHRAARGKSTSF